MNTQKVVLATALRSLLILVVVSAYTFGFYTRVFPYGAAQLFDSVGNTHLSMVYHVRAYEQDKGSVEKLYYAFEKSIEAGDKPNTIKYGKLFLNHPDCEKILNQVNEYVNKNGVGDFDAREWLEAAFEKAGGDLNEII